MYSCLTDDNDINWDYFEEQNNGVYSHEQHFSREHILFTESDWHKNRIWTWLFNNCDTTGKFWEGQTEWLCGTVVVSGWSLNSKRLQSGKLYYTQSIGEIEI